MSFERRVVKAGLILGACGALCAGRASAIEPRQAGGALEARVFVAPGGATLDALKRSPEAMAIKTLFNIFGRGPKMVEDLAVDIFGSKASVVMTNVAGSRLGLYLAGVPFDRMMFWVPHPGRQLGMGISILSYNGAATLAVTSDAHLVPDPETITAQFSREFARMLRAARRPRANELATATAGRPRPRRKRVAGSPTGARSR